MATQTRPFMMTGVALASAAAIVAASPAMAPGIALPSSASLSAATYQLTTFADIFTIPSSIWISSYYQGYGGLLGPTGTPPVANPYANCDNNCYQTGVNGLAYLALDALINGNGKGWSDASAWPISAVNYYFEGAASGGGFTPFVQYVTYTTIDKLPSALQSPLTTLMSLVFAGPPLVSQVFHTVLNTVAGLINQIPTVGPYIAGGIYAYLGQTVGTVTYTPGLTGLVNYVINVVTGNVKPTASTAATSAAAVAAPAAAVPSAVSRALTSAKAASVAAPTVTVAAPNAAAAATASPATAVSAARPAASAAASTPATSGSTAGSNTSSATGSASTGSATSSAATSRSHPVRDAVQKALAGAKAGSAASTGAAK